MDERFIIEREQKEKESMRSSPGGGFVIIVIVFIVTTAPLSTQISLAFQDETFHGGCSSESNCDATRNVHPILQSNLTGSNSDKITPFVAAIDRNVEFLYAVDNDFNASFPVVEYWEEDFTIDASTHSTAQTASPERLPSFLNLTSRTTADRRAYTNYYVLVEYYKPYCDACKIVKEVYLKLASYLRLVFLENCGDHSPLDNSFQAYAINCVRYAHLCSSVQSYPTIRIYNLNDGTTIDLNYNNLHPYTIFEKLGMDDITIHTYIQKTATQMKEQSNTATTTKSVSVDMSNDASWKELAQQLDYIYHQMKQDDLEQDLHVTLDTMLRQYVFLPQNVNMTTNRSARDPPLKLETAQSLRLLIELLVRVVSPINSHLEQFHRMVKELSNSFIYIANHAGYLPVVLDEFRRTPVYNSNSKSGGRSRYSLDCAPRKAIITSNDDESSNDAIDNDAALLQEQSSSYLCGLWKLLFHMIVGGGFTSYNIVALSDNDIIPSFEWIWIVQEYATRVGFGIWSDQEIEVLHNTTFRNETAENVKESPEMQVALWLGVVRNEIQMYRMIHEKENQFPGQRVMGIDLLSVQWPPRQDCPHCWTHIQRKEPPGWKRNPNQYDRPELWNDDIVYKYIQLEYGTPPDSMEELMQLYMDVYPEEFAKDSNQHNGQSEEL
jgi:hypothetical protein